MIQVLEVCISSLRDTRAVLTLVMQLITSAICGFSTRKNISGSRSSSGRTSVNHRAFATRALFLDLIQRLDLAVDSPSLLRRMVSFFMVSMRVCSIAPIVLPLHVGGYCKEYVKGSRPVGVMLEDTWFLRCVVSILTHDARGIQSE